ncbi:MAG: type II toxin-antitoxin system prevent-host-death family antitoxin [Verrucomicrobiota bacterium]
MTSYRKQIGELHELPTIPASEAKNRFGALLDRIASQGPVAIVRHQTPRAVLISIDEFELLRAATESDSKGSASTSDPSTDSSI